MRRRLAAALLLLTPLACAQAWKAGVGRVDITPTEPVWLGGFGSRTKPSEGVRQKIWVKALALEDETGARSVLITSDLLGFTPRMARAAADHALRVHRIPRERLAINSSHTHSAPVADGLLRPAYPYGAAEEAVLARYTEKLLTQVNEAMDAAVRDLAPATLSFEQGNAGFATNRRRTRLRHLPGPVDHDVPVLAVRAPDAKLRAVVFGYACHATSLSDNLVSGDWPGYAQSGLEERYPGATALFVTGAGADANPLPRRTEALARGFGEILATAVDQVLENKMKPLTGPLRTAFATVDLAFAEVPTRAELEARARSTDAAIRRHAEYLLSKGKLWDRYAYPVQVWQFGSALRMVILGGELVVDYALRLKGMYGWDKTWVAGYSNDVFAYIPSVRVLKEGGYEGGGAMIPYGQPGKFHPAVEETIIDTVERLAAQTNGGAPPAR
ncbi:MAG: neutral/alkaline non-lysosomal ceramidase N-terminal domain-containing protein [Bryobacterales bacterium]|nr:neutral/alkaline non-lysosomal ceramidase N-terminal domain-containing protein [Bryobacterales bacterium]